MKKMPLFFIFFILIILVPTFSFSQYILNGNARQESCNCYLITDSSRLKIGSVWQSIKINLENSFDFSFNVYLGCNDSGGDGIVFILATNSNSIGGPGEDLGFQGITPSIGVSLDTYENLGGDPTYDHITISANGNIAHSNDFAGPVPASSVSDNIEDCNWHILRIKWDPSTHTLSTYFDGVFRLSAQKDLVTTIFNNNPIVYWGFSGATGSQFNFQKFCTPLSSDFNTNFSNNATCFGTPVIFKDSSVSFSSVRSYYWDFGDGITSVQPDPPPHNYAEPGIYLVKHSITAADGCLSDQVVRTIKINRANAFAGNDTAVLPNTSFFLHGSGGQFYTWSPATGLSNPDISNPVGTANDDITYVLTVKTPEGCTDTSSIRVKVFKGSAIYVPTGFTPNNDGRNDVLKPTYYGIKSLSYFTIFNRWGQKVFSTNNMNSGWNGSLNGHNADIDSFVWILQAIDLKGKIYNLKGFFTILR